MFNMNWIRNFQTAGLPEEESNQSFDTPNGWTRNSLSSRAQLEEEVPWVRAIRAALRGHWEQRPCKSRASEPDQ